MNKRIRKKLANRSGFHSYRAELKHDCKQFIQWSYECMMLGMESALRRPGSFPLYVFADFPGGHVKSAGSLADILEHGELIEEWDGEPTTREALQADLNAVIAGYKSGSRGWSE